VKAPPLSADEKLEAVIEYLTTRHLEMQGGYPFDYRWFGNKLAIAAIDHDDASRLEVYTKAQLLEIFVEELAT
jgi:hypothetical protein